jgi:glycosyltransferase involved in cell wall biosynthesis
MRILYVSYNHPVVTPGGEQQIAYELFRASLAQGHDAYLIAALEAEQEKTYGKPGAPIVPVHGEARQYFYFPQFFDFVHLSVGDWRTIQFFRELVERINPDVVHFHHYHRIGVESIRAARVAAPDATICLTFHEMMAICLAGGQMLKIPSRDFCHAATPIECSKCFPDLRPEFVTLRAQRLKAMLEECDQFIFPSEFLAERYLDWGLSPEKCVVIPNGQVNPAPQFDRRRHSPLVNRFGFFGQFIDNKGIDVVLEALIILGRENRVPACGIEFEINGGNRHYATPAYLEKVLGMVAEIKRMEIARIRISENGGYGRDQLESRMAAIDWVIVPSTWWEVFGLVASEAWMFGRPVIGSRIGGLGERIEDGVNGFGFPARDARALADLMARLAGDEPEWRRAASGIAQPWSDGQMLEAHMTVWREARERRDRGRGAEGRRELRGPAMGPV